MQPKNLIKRKDVKNVAGHLTISYTQVRFTRNKYNLIKTTIEDNINPINTV